MPEPRRNYLRKGSREIKNTSKGDGLGCHSRACDAKGLMRLEKDWNRIVFCISEKYDVGSWELKSLQFANKELKYGDVQGLSLESADVKMYAV